MEDETHEPQQELADFERRLEDIENRLLELQQRQVKMSDTPNSETQILTLKWTCNTGVQDPLASVGGSLLGVKFKLLLDRNMLYIDVININDLLRGTFCKKFDVTVLHPLGGAYIKRSQKIISNKKLFKHQRLLVLNSSNYFDTLVRQELDIQVSVKDYTSPLTIFDRVKQYCFPGSTTPVPISSQEQESD